MSLRGENNQLHQRISLNSAGVDGFPWKDNRIRPWQLGSDQSTTASLVKHYNPQKPICQENQTICEEILVRGLEFRIGCGTDFTRATPNPGHFLAFYSALRLYQPQSLL